MIMSGRQRRPDLAGQHLAGLVPIQEPTAADHDQQEMITRPMIATRSAGVRGDRGAIDVDGLLRDLGPGELVDAALPAR